MKQEIRWGALAAVAIAAAVGISSRSTGRPQDNAPAVRVGQQKATQSKPSQKTVQTQCSELKDLLQAFFLSENVALPGVCYQGTDGSAAGAGDKSKDTGVQPKFIIATLPDPLHTHFSLLFDRFIEAIQQGAQDEGYEYDSSWLPWETEEPSFALLPDQDAEDDRTKAREDQPGILLFRKAKPKDHHGPWAPYQEALIVFIVGEEPTRGIHRQQFQNAVAWINTLQGEGKPPVAILGPTFSGSFPSLAELLSYDQAHPGNTGPLETSAKELAVYSGSATSSDGALWLMQTLATNDQKLSRRNADGRGENESTEVNQTSITFKGFQQDDDKTLGLFCEYLERKKNGQPTFDLKRLAVLSEDETAYGYQSDDDARI